MRFELQQADGLWIVTRDGAEVGRFESQQIALVEIAARLEEVSPSEPVALGLNFAPPIGEAP